MHNTRESNLTSGDSEEEEEEAAAEAEKKEALSRSRLRKRKMERAKKARAITNSNPMNQFCCQKGMGSLYTILVGVGVEDCDCDCEEEAGGFLRERACAPEGATVKQID